MAPEKPRKAQADGPSGDAANAAPNGRLAGHAKPIVIAVIAGTILSAVIIGVTRYRAAHVRAKESSVNLEIVLKAFDEGKYAEARELADRLARIGIPAAEPKDDKQTKDDKEAAAPKEGKKGEEKSEHAAQSKPAESSAPKLSDADQAGIAYVRGATTVAEAQAASADQKSKLYPIAVRYLGDACRLGFPKGREATGYALLGKSLYSNSQFVACEPFLQEALNLKVKNPGEIHYLLAELHLRQANPDLSETWQQNVQAMADPSLSPQLRRDASIQGAQILLAQGKLADCAALIDKYPPAVQNSPEVLLIKGQLLLERARAAKAASHTQADSLYQEAMKVLRAAQSADSSGGRVLGPSLYLVAECLSETGDVKGALKQFERTRANFPASPEALAASIEEADLLRQQDRPADALKAYQRVLESVGDVENYRNPWISLDRLRQRVGGVFQQYLNAKDYAACDTLARHLAPLFPRDRAMELTAEACRDWGRKLLDEADRLPQGEAENKRRDGRARMRQAGTAYEQLAKLRFATRRYPEEIWNAAQASFDGRDYRHAADMLEEYLKHDNRRRHAVALAMQGESLLNQGRLDEAIKALDYCLARYPRDTAAVRARLVASYAFQEKGEAKQAESLLKENLDSEVLTPASIEWRLSLFELGRLLHHEKRYEEAIPRLEEVAQRYPDWARAADARYLAADCYRQLAQSNEDGLKEVLVESTRILRVKRIEQARLAALTHFQRLRDLLVHSQERGELPPGEKAILRNSYFAIGDMLFLLGRYDEAIKSYEAAIQRHDSSPEALDACTQIVAAHRRMDRPAEAQNAIDQAKLLLNRLKDDVHFLETTNDTREQWRTKLERLSQG
jgi:tetratricopeptide (TPR) repeat protein